MAHEQMNNSSYIKVRGMLQNHSHLLLVGQKTTDLIAITFSGIISNYLYFDSFIPSQGYLTLMMFWIVLSYFCFGVSDAYQPWRGESRIKEIEAVSLPWTISSAAMLIFVLTFQFKVEYSRSWMLIFIGFGYVLLSLLRVVLRYFLKFIRRKGFNQRSVCIIGCGEQVERAYHRLSEDLNSGFKIVAVFADNVKDPAVPITGSQSNYLEWLNKNHINQLWLAMPLDKSECIQDILYDIRHLTFDIRLIPDIFGFNLLNHSLTSIAGLPVVNLNSSPMDGTNAVLKRFEDIILSLLILLISSPMLLTVALLVKFTSKGPVLFKQRRHGFNGQIVEVWKFRSMFVHEEEKVVKQATKNDSRITPLGNFLRKTSLDEFPQFFNVLQGRMSIVGPRPHALSHNEQYKDQVQAYMQRHRVKPGVTGWAQVNGYRGETDTLDKMAKRVEYDIYYINHWSILFDVKIVFLTVFKGFVNPNAY